VSTYYLLPCPCSRKIPVLPKQAGEIVVCDCGTSLEVPTMLKLRALEQTEIASESKPPKMAWGAGHRFLYLGSIIVIAAVAIGIWLFQAKPVDPYETFTPEQIRQGIQQVTPVMSVRYWLMWQDGGLKHAKSNMDIFLDEQKTQYQIKWWLVGILAGIGLAFVAAGIITISQKRKKLAVKR
jgi:hypothetical protein